MRKQLDAAFPTVARYLGLVLMTALIVVTSLGLVALTVAATFVVPIGGMILYKSVLDADSDGGHADRWSHLE